MNEFDLIAYNLADSSVYADAVNNHGMDEMYIEEDLQNIVYNYVDLLKGKTERDAMFLVLKNANFELVANVLYNEAMAA